jgi:WD40 repeat protein
MRLSGFLYFLLILCCATTNAEQPPELVFQAGHVGAINTVEISPDGQWLVSGGQDSTLKIWSLRSGNLLRTLYGHNAKVTSVAISPDGRFVASAADDGTARLWEVAGGQQVRDLTGHRNLISSVAFASSGSVLTGSTDVIKIWDSATGRELRSIAIPQKDQTGRMTLSQDGKVYTIGGAVNQPKTGFLSGFTGGGDIYRPLKIIDIASGRELMSYKTDLQSPFAAYVLSPDSRFFAIRSSKARSSSVEESVRVFDVQTGREIAELKIPGGGGAHAMSPLAISANGRWLAAQGEMNTSMKLPIYVYDIPSKQLLRQFSTSSMFMPSTGVDAVTFVSSPFTFSPDTKVLALGGSSSVQLWEPASGQELRSLQTHLKFGATTDSAMDAQWRESLKAQGISEQDAAIMSQASADVMDTMMDEEGPLGQVMQYTGSLPGMNTMIKAVTREKSIQISPDGKWLVSEGPNVRTWDLATGGLYQDRFPLMSPVAFSSDARLFAAMEMDPQEMQKGNHVFYLIVRDAETRSEISRIKWVNDAPVEMLFGPDQTWIAAHVGNEIRILDTKTLATQRSFPVGEISGDVSIFSKSGRYFAIGGKPVTTTSSTASSSDNTGFGGIDPKMMEQMTKMMGKKMDRKQLEKMQKDMEKMMGTQKPATISGPSPDDFLKPST